MHTLAGDEGEKAEAGKHLSHLPRAILHCLKHHTMTHCAILPHTDHTSATLTSLLVLTHHTSTNFTTQVPYHSVPHCTKPHCATLTIYKYYRCQAHSLLHHTTIPHCTMPYHTTPRHTDHTSATGGTCPICHAHYSSGFSTTALTCAATARHCIRSWELFLTLPYHYLNSPAQPLAGTALGPESFSLPYLTITLTHLRSHCPPLH